MNQLFPILTDKNQNIGPFIEWKWADRQELTIVLTHRTKVSCNQDVLAYCFANLNWQYISSYEYFQLLMDTYYKKLRKQQLQWKLLTNGGDNRNTHQSMLKEHSPSSDDTDDESGEEKNEK